MTQAQKISCVNNAGFVMNFSIRWQDLHGNWNTTKWNSGNYPINQARTSPDLLSIGVPDTAVSATPYVQAVLGKREMGNIPVEYQRNNQVGIYQVKGTTLNYNVSLIQ